MMLFLLLLIFIAVPVIEVWLILEVAELLGGGTRGLVLTMLVLVVDSLIGAVLVRYQGRAAWVEFRDALSSGKIPGNEVVGGGFVVVGATLLLLPGFLSDAVGVLFLIPPTRKPLTRWTIRLLQRQITIIPGSADSGVRDFAHSDQPRNRPPTHADAGNTDNNLEEQRLSE